MARYPQSDQTAVHPSKILSDRDSSLGGVLQHARLLLQVQQLLTSSVDPTLAQRFQVANMRQDRLILLAPTAAWSTRLRLEIPRLLEILRDAGYANLRSIDIRVSPLVEPEARPRAGKPLSAAAEQALGHMARLGAESED